MLDLKPDSPIVHNMVCKRDKLPGHDSIRPAILFMSGGMRGVAGAGAAVALCDLGFSSVADVVIGASAGTANAAYFLAGLQNVRLGASIYYEECVNGRFINFHRRPVVDIDYLVSVFASGPKALDCEAIRQSRSEFFVGVTRYRDGAFHLIDAKTARPDMLTAIRASMAMPGLYDRTVTVNGTDYLDGWIELLPIDQIMRQFQPTDLLVVANQRPPQGLLGKILPADLLFAAMAVGRGHFEYAARSYGRQGRYLESLQAIEQSPVANIGILWAPSGLNLLSTKPDKLLAVAETSYRNTMSLFGQPNIAPNLFRTPAR